MARPPQVTRHITFTRCVCKCFQTTTGTICGIVIDLERIVTDRKKMLQRCRKIAEKDGIRVLEIEDYSHREAFVLQTEIEFLHNGKILEMHDIKNVTSKKTQEEK